MEHINRIELRGRVGTVRTNVVNNSKVANFSLATDYLYKGKDGNAMSETTWHNIVAWEGKDIADIDKICKGTPVHLVGRLRTMKYTNSEGVEKLLYEVIAGKLKILSESSEDNI